MMNDVGRYDRCGKERERCVVYFLFSSLGQESTGIYSSYTFCLAITSDNIKFIPSLYVFESIQAARHLPKPQATQSHKKVAHRPAHKKACREKARELFDEKLYAQPPRKEECPICMIPLPCRDEECTYMSCCGKQICIGCRYCLTRQHCPFCNTAAARSNEESLKRLSDRIEKFNDLEAMMMLSGHYRIGMYGLAVDRSKAFELSQRASELGSAAGHFYLGTLYYTGDGVELDKKKSVNHWQIAAIMGDMDARHNLGIVEAENGNIQRSLKHFMIAAKCGYQKSLDGVKQGFRLGHVTKEDFEKTLRDYQAAKDETKSEQRDRAAVITRARE
eukprot:scaffold162083_cov35-Cyclotella_meneghiniana.AAC.1